MINVINGSSSKPMTAKRLHDLMSVNDSIDGTLYIGYPIIGTMEGAYEIDALLTSVQHGVVAFIMIEGNELPENMKEIQDKCYSMLFSKLFQYDELIKNRHLGVEITIITYAPAVSPFKQILDTDGPVIVEDSKLLEYLESNQCDHRNIYPKLVSAIQAVSRIKVSKKREIKLLDSKGAKLVDLDKSITTLDSQQSKAVLETVNGVQRIRGLAGSGKTIVLARKVAYLHAKNRDWKIAITFNTRSLKNQFIKLITSFVYEQMNELPDWDKIKIIHAWGSPSIEGIYYNLSLNTNSKYYDFRTAKIVKSSDSQNEFDFVCTEILSKNSVFPNLYDLILIDEAQDFAPSFLRLCYEILDENKRLIYAYDELQSLSERSMPNPEDIWGKDENGRPLVNLESKKGEPSRDVILDTCYRNPKPILTAAHALGFGIYRDQPPNSVTPLVQMFDHAPLWKDIGYEVIEGTLSEGEKVCLTRTSLSSPPFLENHSPIDDLVYFKGFSSEQEQIEYLVRCIKKNLEEDELKPEDIMVIHPNAITAREKFGPARVRLLNEGINSNLAGVTTSPDEFYEDNSVTFTSIYRAKGNEAPIVYVINADYCAQGVGLATKRNILFTAMTRTKAWLRVLGVGEGMAILENEFNQVKSRNFTLDFVYPTESQRQHLRIVNRDISEKEKQTIQNKEAILKNLAKDLSEGTIHKEDISPEVLQSVKDALGL